MWMKHVTLRSTYRTQFAPLTQVPSLWACFHIIRAKTLWSEAECMMSLRKNNAFRRRSPFFVIWPYVFMSCELARLKKKKYQAIYLLNIHTWSSSRLKGKALLNTCWQMACVTIMYLSCRLVLTVRRAVAVVTVDMSEWQSPGQAEIINCAHWKSYLAIK